MSLHLKLLDIDHPLTFEPSKLRQIEARALIYLSCGVFTIYTDSALINNNNNNNNNSLLIVSRLS